MNVIPINAHVDTPLLILQASPSVKKEICMDSATARDVEYIYIVSHFIDRKGNFPSQGNVSIKRSRTGANSFSSTKTLEWTVASQTGFAIHPGQTGSGQASSLEINAFPILYLSQPKGL